MNEPPYLTYARYLRERHGCTVHRIAIDAGFGCPNRAGGRSAAGCSYCDPEGSRAPYLSGSGMRDGLLCVGDCDDPHFRTALARQVNDAISFMQRRHAATDFILYFQAYSNTHAPVETLRKVYDTGLALAPFRGLNVATRPDCVDEEKADLLASYARSDLEVWVELGLQSANDATLRRIGRGHTAEDFARAFGMLRERGLKVGIHLIFGLPGEGLAQIVQTIDTIARMRPDGVKIHNLHVPAGTVLAREFEKGEIAVPSPPRHLAYVIAALERLPPRTVIMRLTCDTPEKRLVAPRGFWPKEKFLSRLASEMRARETWQGRLYVPAA